MYKRSIQTTTMFTANQREQTETRNMIRERKTVNICVLSVLSIRAMKKLNFLCLRHGNNKTQSSLSKLTENNSKSYVAKLRKREY